MGKFKASKKLSLLLCVVIFLLAIVFIYPTISTIVLIKGLDSNFLPSGTKNGDNSIFSIFIKQSVEFPIRSLVIVQSEKSRDAYLNLQDTNKLLYEGKTNQLILLLRLFTPEEIVTNSLDGSMRDEKFDCRLTSYHLGRLAYRVNNEIAFKTYVTLCNSGFMHGAIGEMMLDDNISNDAGATLCEISNTEFQLYECYHSLGNGFMASSDNDVVRSIERCSKFNTFNKRGSCYYGVLEENYKSITGYATNKTRTKWDSSEPNKLCLRLGDNNEAQRACYILHFTLIALGNDKTKLTSIIPLCLNIPDKKDVDSCFFGYGIQAAAVNNFDSKKTILSCESVPKEHLFNCLEGAELATIDFWGLDLNNNGDIFCKLTPTEFTPRCKRVLKALMKLTIN